MAKGPLHAVRGTSDPEKMLKNAKPEYSEEAEEIATYTAIEELANMVGDKETATLAKEIRREEERMATFLQKLIPKLADAVAKTEIPSEFRQNGGRRRRRTTSRRATSRRATSSSSRSTGARPASSRSRSSSSRRTTSRSSSGRGRSSSRSSGA
jgi:rubrerythrin